MENKTVKNSLISNELDVINIIQNYFFNNHQTIKKDINSVYHYKNTYNKSKDILKWYKQFIKDNEKSIPVLIFDELINRIDLAIDSLDHIMNELANLESMLSNGQEITFDNLVNLVGKHIECMYSLETKTEEMINEDLNKDQVSLQEIEENDNSITDVVALNIKEQTPPELTEESNDLTNSDLVDISNLSVEAAEEVHNHTNQEPKKMTPEQALEVKTEQINKMDYNKIEYDRKTNYSLEVFTARTVNEIDLLYARRNVLENQAKLTMRNKMEIARITDRIQFLQSNLNKTQEKNVTTFKDKKMDKLYDQEKELQQKLDSVKQEQYDGNLFEGIKKIRIKYLTSKIDKKVKKFNTVKQNQTYSSLSHFENKEAVAKFKSFFTGNMKATKQIYQETKTDLKRFISKMKNNELQSEINLMNSMGVIIEGEENINTNGEIVLEETRQMAA